MISAFKLIKPLTFALTTLALASVTFAGRVAAQSSTATPQPVRTEIQAPEPTNVIPVDMMRSSGKWTTGVRLVESQDYVSQPTSPVSPLPQFKLAEPAWIGMLNMAGQIAASVRLEPSPYGVSGKLGQPTPQLNSPAPRVD